MDKNVNHLLRSGFFQSGLGLAFIRSQQDNPSIRMKLDSRTRANIQRILAIIGVVLSTQAVTAQCPAGSTLNTAGTYTNGQTVCITTGFSGNITLNNGSKMVIATGGNYTGNIDAKKGDSVIVQKG